MKIGGPFYWALEISSAIIQYIMVNQDTYSTKYSDSHAIVIGINNYQYGPPLGYAINDAEATAKTLADEFGFNANRITLLTDKDASRSNIMDLFTSYIHNVGVDDRIVFFFAGHGHTVIGRRGEVGFLVPYDGDTQNLSTLIRWDELTRNADLIPAKHILFVMDACYGGQIFTRSLPPGSMRFLNDMLLRFSRQVLTAGKADEVVSDSGGPIAGHSVFTGHFIEALMGNAAAEDGVITANGVMAYVYEKVAKDQYSKQTPHYGFIEGDGDLIFKAPILTDLDKEEKKDEDVLISIPATMPMTNIDESKNVIDLTKEYLSDPRFTIKLDDLVVQNLREIMLLTSEDNFALQGTAWSLEEFTRRLKDYEQIMDELQHISCCVAYWGTQEHLPVLKRILARLTDRLESQNGLKVWQALRWYPLILLLYSTGISAIAADKYDNLAAILLTKVGSSRSKESTNELALAIGQPILDLIRAEAFKQLPGHERQYVPHSEYLFKLLQPMLDGLLFLGRDYENNYDRFEVLLSLVFIDLEQDRQHIWCPLGRFAWKFNDSDSNPLKEIIAEAARQKESWGPLKAGLFSGDYAHFEATTSKLLEFLPKLKWH